MYLCEAPRKLSKIKENPREFWQVWKTNIFLIPIFL